MCRIDWEKWRNKRGKKETSKEETQRILSAVKGWDSVTDWMWTEERLAHTEELPDFQSEGPPYTKWEGIRTRFRWGSCEFCDQMSQKQHKKRHLTAPGEVKFGSWEKASLMVSWHFPLDVWWRLQLIMSKTYLLQANCSQKWQFHISRHLGEMWFRFGSPVPKSSHQVIFIFKTGQPFWLHPLPTLVTDPLGFDYWPSPCSPFSTA